MQLVITVLLDMLFGIPWIHSCTGYIWLNAEHGCLVMFSHALPLISRLMFPCFCSISFVTEPAMFAPEQTHKSKHTFAHDQTTFTHERAP